MGNMATIHWILCPLMLPQMNKGAQTVKEIAERLEEVRGNQPEYQKYLISLADDSRVGIKRLIQREQRFQEQYEKKVKHMAALVAMEQQLYLEGYHLIAGVDEAGRGPLAGPVVAAAVILPTEFSINLTVDDSKKLTERTREKLFDLIVKTAVDVQISLVTPAEIDQINILQATLLAMRRAVTSLRPQPDIVLVDGNQKISALNLTQRVIIEGDAKVRVIAAASIVAKVYRDRLMQHIDEFFPDYYFAQHKGYPTVQHRNIVQSIGKTIVHRRTFIKDSHEE